MRGLADMKAMMLRIDLHTHSTDSPDGGISRLQYQRALHSGMLDVVAVTDHNSIYFAKLLQKEFGNRVIVGEEIMTTGGEIIGLYLEEAVPKGLSPLDTVQRIKQQEGLVYIPHPFETVRSGISMQDLDAIASYVDILEIYNGRAVFQNKSKQAVVWARMHRVAGAASSDAHGYRGLGKAYSVIAHEPTKDTLLSLLGSGSPNIGRPSVRALLYPKYHRLRRKIVRSSQT